MVDALNILNFPAYTDPAAFAATVMDESQTGAVELSLLEAALEADGLTDLAEAVGIVEINRRSGLLGEAKLRGTIERISRDYPDQLRGLVEKLHQHSAVARQLGNLERAKAHLLAQIREARVARDKERVRTTGGMIRVVGAEERLAGRDWRQKVLPLVLEEKLGWSAEPVQLAWDVLDDPSQPVSIKVIALRVLGDHKFEPENGLKTLQIIADIWADSKADPRLKEMAWALLRDIRFPSPDFPEGDLKERLLFVVHTRLSRSSFARSADNLDHWESDYPPWYSVLSEVLGLDESKGDLAVGVRTVFANESEPVWRRALSLVFYSFLISSHRQFFLAPEEAADASENFLRILSSHPESDLLHPMAVDVYGNVVTNQIGRATHTKSNEVLIKIAEWARFKADQLDIDPSLSLRHREAEKIRAYAKHIINGVLPAREAKLPVVLQPRSPWWRRLLPSSR